MKKHAAETIPETPVGEQTLCGGVDIRAKHLAMRLSKLPNHPGDSANLEQYPTEGNLAAQWLLDMNEHLALFGTRVVDLGAGNGILGLGTLMLGAKSATLIEADPDVAEIAQQSADEITREYGGIAEVLALKVEGKWPDDLAADIIVMNPPWGYQNRGADRPMIEAALESPAHTIHLLHSAAASHPAAMARDAGWKTELRFEVDFRLPANMVHHTSKQAVSKAAIWRFQR